MTTGLLTREVYAMHQEERPQQQAHPRPPGAFKDYVWNEHQRFYNEAAGLATEFKGELHHVIRTAEGRVAALPFTRAFETYLSQGPRVEEMGEAAIRWVRVEAAVVWLEKEDQKMGRVARYFQTPAWARNTEKRRFANEIELTEDELESWKKRALRRLWWKLGYTF